MGRPTTITLGDDATSAIRVEYVRHRRMLRLWGCPGDTRAQAPVELPLHALVELGVPTEELVPPHRFLLFAGGRGPARGGARDLVATYESGSRARDAFVALRRRGDADWAELVALEANGGVKRLAWFGSPAGDTAAETGSANPGRWRRRRRSPWMLAGDRGGQPPAPNRAAPQNT